MSNSWLDPDWGVQRLDEAPAGKFSGQSKVYVLIESTLMHDWQQVLYQHINRFGLAAPYFERLFDGTAYQHLEHGPVLIDVTEFPQLQTLWLTRFEEQPVGCILLTPDTETASDLASTLRNRLTVVKNDSPTFLRYYEPRMLLPLWGALSLEERQIFMPQVHAVYWYHRGWLQVHWPVSPVHHGQLSSWNVTSNHMQKMASIMTTIQSHEVSA